MAWKKVIVSGSAISQLDNDAGYIESAGGGIVSASAFSSDAQGLLTASINGEITEVDLGLTSTADVEFGSVTASLQGNVVGDLTGTADTASYANATNVWFSTGNNQTLLQFSASVVGTIEENQADALQIIADNDTLIEIGSTETASFAGGEGISTSATGNEVTIAMSDNYSIAGSGSVGAGFTVGGTAQMNGELNVDGNATIAGDLTVNGTTTTINTTNLNIEDKFILLSSGSTSGNDAGIVVEGQGTSFGWDESENRWAFDFSGATADQTTITADAYAAAVVITDDANYRKNGNIRVESGEIFIWA
jgi:hypothetical protein